MKNKSARQLFLLVTKSKLTSPGKDERPSISHRVRLIDSDFWFRIFIHASFAPSIIRSIRNNALLLLTRMNTYFSNNERTSVCSNNLIYLLRQYIVQDTHAIPLFVIQSVGSSTTSQVFWTCTTQHTATIIMFVFFVKTSMVGRVD